MDGSFDKLRVMAFYPGHWVAFIEKAVNNFAAHSCMEIDDSSLVDEIKQAFLSDKSLSK